MSITKKVFLVGMPGSGKSTLGKSLAEYFQLEFKDLDEIIEINSGLGITTIFETYGEEKFRELEREALINVCNSIGPKVIAAGGGTPCFFENMKEINQSGVSLFIDTPIEVIIERLSATEIEKRPLISKLDRLDFRSSIMTKYSSRVNYYLQAHYKIKGDESLDFISQLIS